MKGRLGKRQEISIGVVLIQHSKHQWSEDHVRALSQSSAKVLPSFIQDGGGNSYINARKTLRVAGYTICTRVEPGSFL
jgi:hypothetical protein